MFQTYMLESEETLTPFRTNKKLSLPRIVDYISACWNDSFVTKITKN